MMDIAVIGMALRLPDASSVEDLWQNLLSGRESVRFFSREALKASGVPAELAARTDYVPAKAELAEVDLFDAEFFGMTPKQAAVTDPQQRLLLTLCHEALVDAGHYGKPDLRAGVFAGVGTNTYLIYNLLSNPQLLAEVDDYQLGIGNNKDYASLLVSYKLGLVGPSVTVQAACSTSLVAVHQACASLRNEECELALAGGVSLSLPRGHGYLYRTGGILSADGHCRPFDGGSTGTVRGEGGAVVVLKPRAQAEADRDQIYAVIRGTAINNDGARKVGFSAPSAAGQEDVIRSALKAAGLAPRDIGFVEGHGSGTVLGDAVELSALKETLGGDDRTEPLVLGSLKGNLGHLDAAAGVAGFIKTCIMVQRGWMPPTLHFQRFSPEATLGPPPFRVNREPLPWPGTALRRAGVSSFGIGGTNCHVVVEQASARPAITGRQTPPFHLFALSAANESALRERVRQLQAVIRAETEASLEELAYALYRSGSRPAWRHRLALVVATRDETLTILDALLPASQAPLGTADGRPVLVIEAEMPIPSEAMERLARDEVGFREQLASCPAGVSSPPLLALGMLLLDRGLAPQTIVGVGSARDVAAVLAARAGAQLRSAEPGEVSKATVLRYAAAGKLVVLLSVASTPADATDAPPHISERILRLSLAEAAHSRRSTLNLLARLWQLGAEIALGHLWKDSSVRKVPFPSHPLQEHRHWVEPVDLGRGLLTAAACIPADVPMARSSTTFADVEALLYQVVGGVLGHNDISGDMDFFDLGGDSLKAIHLLARVKEVFRCEIALADLLEAPTLRDQAVLILGAMGQTPGDRAGPEAQDEIARALEEIEALSTEEVKRQLAE